MSTAWYRGSKVVPRLVKRWTTTNTRNNNQQISSLLLDAIEVWETTCVVTNFGIATSPSHCSILINPANQNLRGVSDFPYFPKGGPQPPSQPLKDAHHIMGYVTQWGGMEVGQGMMFAANVVDGLVHQLGGKALQQELLLLKRRTSTSTRMLGGYGDTDGAVDDPPCPEGQAVWTWTPTSSPLLRQHYEAVVHTVPPFYGHSPHSLLEDCYRNSLHQIHEHTSHGRGTTNERGHGNSVRVACPLLGAGCRGFPATQAIEMAAAVLVDCCHTELASRKKVNDEGSSPALLSRVSPNEPNRITLAFAIPSGVLRQTLVEAIDRYWLAVDETFPTNTV